MPRTRKSTPPISPAQRRRQIIDLLAGHLARMPEALVVSSPPENETEAHPSRQGVTTQSLNVSRFRGSAPASHAAHGLPAPHLAESYHAPAQPILGRSPNSALEVSAN